MNPEDALAACETAVRHSDPDRYFASLFAPAEKRPLLFALYAFNHEIARAAEIARDPMMAEIRLQWWRESVDEARQGRPRAQPVAIALSELLGRGGISAADLEALIDARAEEISSAPFADLTALEAHIDATSGELMRAASFLLDSRLNIGEITREAGIAYGIAGTLRAIPFHAARGKTFLPLDLLAADGLTANDALSVRHLAGIRKVISRLARAAKDHFEKARHAVIPKPALPAILPASLVPAYLRHVTRHDRDPLRDRSEILLLRRQLIYLRAAAFGDL
jgi:phytoene synthase